MSLSFISHRFRSVSYEISVNFRIKIFDPQEMEVVLASLMMNSLGQKPTKEGIMAIIQSVGGNLSESEIDAFLSRLGEKDLNTLINEGLEKIQSCQQAAAPVAVSTESAPEQKKEEEAPKVEEDIDVFDALF